VAAERRPAAAVCAVADCAVLGKMIRSTSPRNRIAGEWIGSVTLGARNRQPDEPPRDCSLNRTGRAIGREWTAAGNHVQHGRGAEHDCDKSEREASAQPGHHPLESTAPRGVATARRFSRLSLASLAADP